MLCSTSSTSSSDFFASDNSQSSIERNESSSIQSSSDSFLAMSSSESSQESLRPYPSVLTQPYPPPPRRSLRNTRSSRSGSAQSSASSSTNGNVRINVQFNARNDTTSDSDSSDTEPYDVNALMAREHDESDEDNAGPVIEINDTQDMVDDDDDDVILIPQHIETIDLCTQALTVPENLRNQVIDITDSPLTQPPNVVADNRTGSVGPMRQLRNQNPRNATPYDRNRTAQPKAASTPNIRKGPLNLDDSQNMSQTQRVEIRCPICLESVINRSPQSTTCGHIFCKDCLALALRNVRKCPMCKKNITKNGFHSVFLA